MKNDTTFDKIEAWLSGELPEAEARAFEAEMATDTALAAEVERHRRGREALDRLAEQSLQGNIARWRESMDELPVPPADARPVASAPNRLGWILGGLLLILLVGAAYWFWPSENIQQSDDTIQKSDPLQSNPNVPIAVTPSDEPVNENNDPEQPAGKNSPKLLAMAETNLSNFRGAILNNYKDQRGDEDEENPFFKAGLKAFQSGNFAVAKKNLLQIPADNDYFSAAQEMLASLYFKEKDYSKAVKCYESYAHQNADPAKDWRLLQFYLADYQNHKTDFWKELDKMTQPGYQPLQYQKEAIILRLKLSKIGVK